MPWSVVEGEQREGIRRALAAGLWVPSAGPLPRSPLAPTEQETLSQTCTKPLLLTLRTPGLLWRPGHPPELRRTLQACVLQAGPTLTFVGAGSQVPLPFRKRRVAKGGLLTPAPLISPRVHVTSFSRGDSSPDACSVCVLMGKDGDEISGWSCWVGANQDRLSGKPLSIRGAALPALVSCPAAVSYPNFTRPRPPPGALSQDLD